MPRICKVCGKSAHFGIKFGSREYCAKHKLKGMIDLSKPYCMNMECSSLKAFFKDASGKRYCEKHKPDNYEIKKKEWSCTYKECTKDASFAKIGEIKAVYCAKHVPNKKDYVDVISKLCVICGKNATRGYLNDKFPSRCLKHSRKGMEDIKNKKCKECKRQPSFGYNDQVATHCDQHKLDGMIDVKHKNDKCEICKNHRPTFGFEGEKPMRCVEHRLENMIDLVSKRCLEENCYVQPSFGFEDEGKVLYCKRHKKEEMIHLTGDYCLECHTQATYNFQGESKGKYCAFHAKENMVDVVNPRCVECHKFVVIRPQTLCAYCNPNAHEKTKELKVIKYLEKNISEKFIHNKRAKGKRLCRFLPDVLFICSTYYLIIEIDEKQHRQYTKENEEIRMKTIQEDLGKPIIFLRYNPDSYKINGKRTNSSLENRMKILKQKIKKYLNLKIFPEKSIRVLKLFYDCDEKKSVQIWEM